MVPALFQIIRDKVTWPGARIRKKGEGMPSFTNNNDRGFMFITVDVSFPKGELNSEQKQLIRDLLQQDTIAPKVCI